MSDDRRPSERRRYHDIVAANAVAAAEGTHCSACGRKLRPKVMPGGAAPNRSFPTPWVDWLNHRLSCTRYGLSPDA